MDRQSRRRFRPIVDRIEARELLSAIGLHPATDHRQERANTLMNLVSSGRLAGGNGSVHAQAAITNPAGDASAIVGTNPTPRELARERFRGVFVGPFDRGPARFANQQQQLFIRGTGSSTFFRHGSMQLLIITPTDPKAPLVGTAQLLDKSINSGGLLAVDLSGTRADLDRFGRPTHLTYTLNPFSGSGSFTGGLFSLSSGQGTVDIRYGRPVVGHHRGTLGSEVATVLFKGTIFTSGTFDPLQNANFIQSHDRIL